jgi:hypothetical protein
MVTDIVFQVGTTIMTPIILLTFAFRPHLYGTGACIRRLPGVHRVMLVCTVFWAIFLPVDGAAGLATGSTRSIAEGAIALAAWPLVLLALVKLRRTAQAARQLNRPPHLVISAATWDASGGT